MTGEKGSFKTRDGLSIFWKAWYPDVPPKAVIHLIHGYAEHVDRYGFVVDELVPDGYAVFGTDHRGHGRSEGRRGHVECFQELIDDEKRFKDEIITGRLPDIPCFALGHSMGSIIAMNYAVQFPAGVQGLVLSGTGSVQGPAINKVLILLTKAASRLIPRVHVKSPLPPDFISRDPAAVKAYIDDPLVFNVITPRLAEQLNTYVAIGAAHAGLIKAPVLIQYGSSDTSFSGQEELFDRIGARDKTIKRYEGLKHEVYNELPEDRAQVISDLHAWLDAHL